MRIRKYFLSCFLPAIAILCFVLLSLAFAAMEKVDETELAQTRASLTGQIVTTSITTELAPAKASRTGQKVTTSIPADSGSGLDAAKEFYSSAAIPTEGELATNGGSLFPLHNDYGYNWLQNLKAVGDLYPPAPEELSPLSVVAGRDGGYGANVSYVRVGLGSQEVGFDTMDVDVTLGSKAKAASPGCCQQILGTLHLDGLSVKTDGTSYVTIYKADGQMGVNTKVDVEIDRISIANLSWGDADGFPGAGNTSKAGYVGLNNTNIMGVTASGPVEIGIVTIQNGNGNGNWDIGTNAISAKIGNGVDNVDVGMVSLDTTVVVGDKKDFSGTKYTLGTLYMNNLKMNVGGFLDIYTPADNNTATTIDFGLNVSRLTLETLSWGDSDGVGDTSTAGYVGLKNLAITNLAIAGNVTLDTMTVQAGDASLLPVGAVFVRLGFSKMDVKMDSLDTDVALGSDKNMTAQSASGNAPATTAGTLGSIYLGGLEMNVNGNVDIHPPSACTQGVVLDLNISADVNLKAISWGDADGMGGSTTAGYRGWRNMAINGLTLNGPVSINVATVDANVSPTSSAALIYSTYATHQMSPSFVHLGLGTGDANNDPAGAGALVVGINSLSADVVLDSSKSLDSTHAGVLRTLYLSGMTARINGWVDIGAH